MGKVENYAISLARLCIFHSVGICLSVYIPFGDNTANPVYSFQLLDLFLYNNITVMSNLPALSQVHEGVFRGAAARVRWQRAGRVRRSAEERL